MPCTITILSSSENTPLTKTYKREDDGTITKIPYPHIYKVSSTTREVSSVRELFTTVELAALSNGCLMKGVPVRPLNNESRAESHDPLAMTSWLVLDYDRSEGFASVEAMLMALDPALANVSYVFQHSCSSGIEGGAGLRGHVFILLRRPVPPGAIKEWARKLNFTVPELRARLELSSCGLNLKYPLDITVNQNDKLIYVAPPRCVGFADPMKEPRIVVMPKSQELFDFEPRFDPQWNRDQRDKVVAELRELAGLPRRMPRYKMEGDWPVITNVGPMTVTDIKKDRDFYRFNFNGSTSWGYWAYRSNPRIVYSFSTESGFYLNDVAPETYQRLAGEANQERREELQIKISGYLPHAFRDPETDTYYTCFAQLAQGLVKDIRKISTKDRIADFFAQYGEPMPDPIEDWTIGFEPTSTRSVDFDNKWINAYSAPPLLRVELVAEETYPMPSLSELIIRHACGNDQTTYEHFINWAAWVIQNRQRAKTAWLFTGTEGTGKGAIFHNILSPILGTAYCKILRTVDLLEKHNGWLRHKLLVFGDEIELGACRKHNEAMDKIRTMVTEPRIPVRAMHQDGEDFDNFASFIFGSNKRNAIVIPDDDRRWNIAPRQEEPLKPILDSILGETRLEDALRAENADAAKHFLSYKCCASKVLRPLASRERETLIATSRSSQDEVFYFFRKGTVDWFMEHMLEKLPISPGAYMEFAEIVRRWHRHAATNEICQVTNAELRSVYEYLSGEAISPVKFGQLALNNGVQFTQRTRLEKGGKAQLWIGTKFHTNIPLEEVESYKNVIPMGGKR